MITLYGIKNCDTVKKASKWLEQHNIEYQLHDFKKQALTSDLLTEFVKLSDWSLLLNKRSTSFRNLPENIKNNLTDEIIFTAVIEQPTLLKRPLLPLNGQLNLGFSAQKYQALFSKDN
jgi:arsenate reductase|tara:strand:+ start:129 stop:482 length:354 start_codon:yes stop_codon:yes gene_type:complete